MSVESNMEWNVVWIVPWNVVWTLYECWMKCWTQSYTNCCMKRCKELMLHEMCIKVIRIMNEMLKAGVPEQNVFDKCVCWKTGVLAFFYGKKVLPHL